MAKRFKKTWPCNEIFLLLIATMNFVLRQNITRQWPLHRTWLLRMPQKTGESYARAF